MFPRYPPEQPRAGASADQTAHLTVRDTVFLEGDNPFAVLPVKVQAVTAAVLTAADRQLVLPKRLRITTQKGFFAP